MTNVYGYNRKTKEEDEAILAAVKRHHDVVAAKGYMVVITSLVGSQNYDLDHENSDIDTFSLVYPTLNDIAKAKEPYAGMFELKDGHCEVKDIRLALNLLRKTSPNSVEYFTSKYKIYNPIFESILKDYLDDNNKLWNMIHCNYSHMLYAMAGMAHQLTKRNMPAGKRYSHALRLYSMSDIFLDSILSCLFELLSLFIMSNSTYLIFDFSSKSVLSLILSIASLISDLISSKLPLLLISFFLLSKYNLYKYIYLPNNK